MKVLPEPKQSTARCFYVSLVKAFLSSPDKKDLRYC